MAEGRIGPQLASRTPSRLLYSKGEDHYQPEYALCPLPSDAENCFVQTTQDSVFWAQCRVNNIEYVKIRQLPLGPDNLQNDREEH